MSASLPYLHAAMLSVCAVILAAQAAHQPLVTTILDVCRGCLSKRLSYRCS